MALLLGVLPVMLLPNRRTKKKSCNLMQEILDDFQKKERPAKSQFSKFSFAFALISMLLFAYTVYRFIQFRDTTLIPSKYIIYMDQFAFLSIGIFLFCLIGTMLSILSYLRAEPANFYKIAGALINFFLFSLLLMGVYFSKFI